MAPSRLLVIDDSPTIRKLVELSFKSRDVQLSFAGTGKEGTTQAVAAPPDVILLDFVLPDMKGTDVCRKLAQDKRSAGASIILMSAKHEDVRRQFDGFDSVVDFVGKPFTAEEIVRRVAVALERRTARDTSQGQGIPVPSPSAPHLEPLAFSFAQKQTAAQALYAKLRPALLRIPEWMSEVQGSGLGPYLAKKILTPERVDELLAALAPTYREALGTSSDSSSLEGGAFEGSLEGWPVIELYRMFERSGRTGELSVRDGEHTTLVSVVNGEIRLASTRDPVEYGREAGVDLAGVPADVRARAEAEQRASGKPIFVTIAEAGKLPARELAATLYRQSKRALLGSLDSQRIRFRFRELSAQPMFVQAYGRSIPTLQLELERIRSVGGLASPDREVVFERIENFSRTVRDSAFNAEERGVLALVDGRQRAHSIASRGGGLQALAVLARLHAVGLVRVSAAVTAPAPSTSAKRVLVSDPDPAFRAPLKSLLGRRPEPIEVVGVDGGEDLVEAIARKRPTLAVVHVAAAGEGVLALPEQVHRNAEHRTLLLAVLENGSKELEAKLFAAGYDAVIEKPVPYVEIERLLSD